MVEPSETGPASNGGDEHRGGFFISLVSLLRRLRDAFGQTGSRRIHRQYHRLDRRAHLDAELDDPDFDR